MYPTLELVLEECGLDTMAQYIKVRRNTVVQSIPGRPVFNFCRDSRRRPGTSPRQWWWEQLMDLEEVRED